MSYSIKYFQIKIKSIKEKDYKNVMKKLSN